MLGIFSLLHPGLPAVPAPQNIPSHENIVTKDELS